MNSTGNSPGVRVSHKSKWMDLGLGWPAILGDEECRMGYGWRNDHVAHGFVIVNVHVACLLQALRGPAGGRFGHDSQRFDLVGLVGLDNEYVLAVPILDLADGLLVAESG